jgi:hypothetical protein
MHQCGVCYIIIFIIKSGALTYWGVKQHNEISIGGYIIAPSKLHNYFEVKLPSWILIFELCVLNYLWFCFTSYFVMSCFGIQMLNINDPMIFLV